MSNIATLVARGTDDLALRGLLEQALDRDAARAWVLKDIIYGESSEALVDSWNDSQWDAVSLAYSLSLLTKYSGTIDQAIMLTLWYLETTNLWRLVPVEVLAALYNDQPVNVDKFHPKQLSLPTLRIAEDFINLVARDGVMRSRLKAFLSLCEYAVGNKEFAEELLKMIRERPKTLLELSSAARDVIGTLPSSADMVKVLRLILEHTRDDSRIILRELKEGKTVESVMSGLATIIAERFKYQYAVTQMQSGEWAVVVRAGDEEAVDRIINRIRSIAQPVEAKVMVMVDGKWPDVIEA